METNCKTAWEVQLEMWEHARVESRNYTQDELALVEALYGDENENSVGSF